MDGPFTGGCRLRVENVIWSVLDFVCAWWDWMSMFCCMLDFHKVIQFLNLV